jgi:hypothetical protein
LQGGALPGYGSLAAASPQWSGQITCGCYALWLTDIAITGFPFTINLNGDRAGIGGGTGGILIRPNAVPGARYERSASQRSTERYFNTAAFALPPAGAFGNVGRNTVIGPGLLNLDTTVSRTFAIGERIRVQARGEFFNVMNMPNYRPVGRLINVPASDGKVRAAADSVGSEGILLT